MSEKYKHIATDATTRITPTIPSLHDAALLAISIVEINKHGTKQGIYARIISMHLPWLNRVPLCCGNCTRYDTMAARYTSV